MKCLSIVKVENFYNKAKLPTVAWLNEMSINQVENFYKAKLPTVAWLNEMSINRKS